MSRCCWRAERPRRRTEALATWLSERVEFGRELLQQLAGTRPAAVQRRLVSQVTATLEYSNIIRSPIRILIISRLLIDLPIIGKDPKILIRIMKARKQGAKVET